MSSQYPHTARSHHWSGFLLQSFVCQAERSRRQTKGFPLQSLTQTYKTTFLKIPDSKYFKSQTKILLLKKKLKIMTAIKKEIAKKMIQVYKARKIKIKDSDGSPKDDTDSVWLSKEYLRKFLYDLNPNSTGLRIYLGVTGSYDDVKYPDVNKPDQVAHVKKYMNQTNLIFVATQSPAGTNPTMSNSTNLITNKEDSSEKDLSEESKTIILIGEGMAHNEMDMCPPGKQCEEIL